MTSLFDNVISQNTRCFACGSLVYAVEKKLTTHHVYHNRCFRCRICKRNLTGFSLNEEGDDIYCTNCYRRKQRGDCNSLEFYRAAAEKAQFIHNRLQREQQNPVNNSRPSSLRDTSRNPSITLRHLERRFRFHKLTNKDSHNDVNQNNNNNIDNNIELKHENNQPPLTPPQPLRLCTRFSSPTHLNDLRRNSSSSSTKDDQSPQYFPAFSPNSTRRTETTITPHLTQVSNELINANDEHMKPTTLSTSNATCGIEFRLNKSNIDLTHITSSQTKQKSIIIPDLNQKHTQRESRFRFPDIDIKSVQRRSMSAHHLKNSPTNH